MTRKQKAALAVVTVGLALLTWRHCRSDWPEHDGKIQQVAHLETSGLRRGAKGVVQLRATGVYAAPARSAIRSFEVPRIGRVALALLDAAGKSTPLATERFGGDAGWSGYVTLPDVPDGDYRLHAEVATKLGKTSVEAPLPLYAPARVHVLTDRPLYEAGNVVRFRAVVLRARDLAPLDARPGHWIVRDPNGEVLLEERAPSGEFGVVAGSFPLDASAPEGIWRVEWSSGDARQERSFTVKPFTLPRFRVEASAAQPFYTAGDAPALRGAVTYASGAPVARASLEITWRASGDWPLPRAWEDGLLPAHAVAAADGQFALELPALPPDLTGRTTLEARIAATDAAGDRVTTTVPLLLSADRLQASAVTELGDGLVEGFNNRLYVRVTTPDGRVLQGAKLKVKRAWQASDPGVEAVVDEDGVAALQIDPGPAVNVVIPPAPWRPARRPPLVARGEVTELLTGQGAALADQLELDRWVAGLATCGKWYADARPEARVALRVAASGAITTVAAGEGELAQCVARALRGRRLAAGAERMYTVPYRFRDPDLPSLRVSIESALAQPPELEAALRPLAASARDCLPAEEGALPRALSWRVAAGSKEVVLGPWLDDPRGGAAAAAVPCVVSRLGSGRLALATPATTEQLGLIRLAVALPEEERRARPQATTMLGYEFIITAEDGVESAPRTTKLRLPPGEVPALRMRLTPVLAKAGEPVTAELIRGPTFADTLPKVLLLRCLQHEQEQKLDAERRAVFTIPADAEGWCEVLGGGARGLLYLRPRADLRVAVTPEKPRYAPGQQAKLTVRTWLGGQGGRAAVGLFGVDQSLAQLVALPGVDDLDAVRPVVESEGPAFGTLDGQALTLGRIVGANAAAAAVLRVTTIPPAAELDAEVSVSARTELDPIAVLTDRFYVVLAELYAQAREWERTSPPADKMRPEMLAKLWTRALDACKRRGESVEDSFGRPLRLRILPADLLALTDPHVVITGTRLPEDVENWAAWVARRKP